MTFLAFTTSSLEPHVTVGEWIKKIDWFHGDYSEEVANRSGQPSQQGQNVHCDHVSKVNHYTGTHTNPLFYYSSVIRLNPDK